MERMSLKPQRQVFSADPDYVHASSVAQSVTAASPGLPVLQPLAAPARTKRKHASQACDRCRAKRTRCDGNPLCQTCINAHASCLYQLDDQRRVRVRQQSIQHLEAQNEELRAVLDVFQHGDEEDALSALRLLRSQAHPSPEQAFSNISLDSVSLSRLLSLSLSSDDLENVRDDRNSRPSSLSSHNTRRFRQGTPSHPPVFTSETLPAEAIVRKGADFFFRVIAGLFHVMTVGEFNRLCDSVYRSGSVPDGPTLARLCAVAAIGAHYNFQDISGELKDTLFNTAVRYMPDMVQLGNLDTMKYLACLAAYGVVDKRGSTKRLTQLGLQVARRNLAAPNHVTAEILQDWKRLYRTMMFFECWLATTLGYTPDFGTIELEFADPVTSLATGDSITQIKATEIFMLKARVCVEVCCPEPPAEDAIELYMRDLERWFQGLPRMMTLIALLNSEASPLTAAEQGGLLLAHAIYLGAVVMLHRRALIAFSDGILDIAAFSDNRNARVQVYLDRSVEAARAIVRIFIFLRFGTGASNMHVRCWISIFEVWTACNILLYNIALQIIQHTTYHADIRLDLDRVTTCMGMLEVSALSDNVSRQMWEALLPIYRAIMVSTGHRSDPAVTPQLEARSAFGLQQPEKSRSSFDQSSVFTPGSNSPYSCVSAIQALRRATNVLRDPFAHGLEAGFQLPASRTSVDTSDWWFTAS